MSNEFCWVDTHCHLDAPEFSDRLSMVVSSAQQSGLKAILVPAVRAGDGKRLSALTTQYHQSIPGLVYTLGIHPLYTPTAKEGDLQVLESEILQALTDPRFVGIGEIGLDYFVPELDSQRQELYFQAQLSLAEKYHLPVILHVRRSCDAILKALRRRSISGGIAHAFNGSLQQAEQFIGLGFKLGFGGAATYERALHLRRLLKDLPLDCIVTETDAPDIPPAWLREEGGAHNEPAFLPRIAGVLADIRGIHQSVLMDAVWQNALQAVPRWSMLLSKPHSLSVA